MFIEFTTENYLSFKEPATLTMVASKLKSRNKALNSGATFPVQDTDLSLLKCAAVYGANASGKSNLFAAIRFMRGMVINSSKESQVEQVIDVSPYLLSVGYSDRPSRFEMVLIAHGAMYVYGFTLDKKHIHAEKLVQIKGSREKILFSRNAEKITVTAAFPEGVDLVEKTRPNALFLSVCANFAGTVSGQIVRWFHELALVSGLEDLSLLPYTISCLEDESSGLPERINDLLKVFDLGIDRIGPGKPMELPVAEKFPKDIQHLIQAVTKFSQEQNLKFQRITSFHTIFDDKGNPAGEISFDLGRDESEGTKKLVALSAVLVAALLHSKTVLIDEFDSRLHPVLSKNIIKLFNSPETNSGSAQLIVATHDTNILDKDLLRRDQIWFCEKDPFGASHLTSLAEFKVRNDASFEKDYIMGKYGAIPLLGNINRVFSNSLRKRD